MPDSEEERETKTLEFPKVLLNKIAETKLVPKYLDFTTKVFILLEFGLSEEFRNSMRGIGR